MDADLRETRVNDGAKHSVRGSFTVEATLLMTLILPILVGIIYLSFFLHNSAAMKGAACELTSYLVLQEGKEEEEKLVKEKIREIKAMYLPGVQGIKVDVNHTKKKIEVKITGDFLIPGWIKIFWRDKQKLESDARKEKIDAAKKIREIEGLKSLTEEMF